MSEDWAARAACKGADLGLFFPGKGNAAAAYDAARALCARCLVQPDCLEDALSRPRQVGFQAGMTVGQRNAVKREREAAGR